MSAVRVAGRRVLKRETSKAYLPAQGNAEFLDRLGERIFSSALWLSRADEIVGSQTSMRLVDQLDLGLHYAATLRLWADAFQAAQDEVERMGFDATFSRMWFFYLAYCEAGFAAEYIDVNQLVFVKEERS